MDAYLFAGKIPCYYVKIPQAAIIALFRVMNRYVGNLPPMPGVFPDYPAPVGSRPLVQITPKGPTGCKLVGTVKGTKLWAGNCEASELRRSVPAAETTSDRLHKQRVQFQRVRSNRNTENRRLPITTGTELSYHGPHWLFTGD